MRRSLFRRNALGAFVAAAAFLSGTCRAEAANYVAASSSTYGLVLVNQLNGNITMCPMIVSNTNAPINGCVRMGSMPTASLAGNVSILFSSGGVVNGTIDSVFYVINTQTGGVLECSMVASQQSGKPLGSCVGIQAP